MSAKGDKTKELICSEAYKLFAEKGFKEVTMKDICEKTGLSRGGLYRHYSSTEEIFSHIINSLMQTQENEVLNKIESLVPAKQILLELLNRYQIEMLDSSNCLTLAIYEFFSTLQRKGNESLLYEQYLLSKKTWESLIAYGIKTKEFNEVNAEAIIDIINQNADITELIAYGEICSAGFDIFFKTQCRKAILENTIGMAHFTGVNVNFLEQ